MKKNKNLILENIKLTSAGAKGVSVPKNRRWQNCACLWSNPWRHRECSCKKG